MGILIQGPWKKQAELKSSEEENPMPHGPAKDYPWYALSGPKGTTAKQHRDTVSQLQRLASIAGDTGSIILPNGWFWDTGKIQVLIDNLSSIGQPQAQVQTHMPSEEIPDDIA